MVVDRFEYYEHYMYLAQRSMSSMLAVCMTSCQVASGPSSALTGASLSLRMAQAF